jgi:uncharacterized protein
MLRLGKKHFIVGSILAVSIGLLSVAFTESTDVFTRTHPEFVDMVELWQSGYLTQMAIQSGIALFILIISPLFILWQSLGLMLLGVYLYRDGFFSRGFDTKQLSRFTLLEIVVSLITSLPPMFLPQIDSTVSPLFNSVSAIFVALLYAHCIIKLSQKSNVITKSLQACGRIAFSLYLMQSICMAILFRGFIPLHYPEFLETITMLDFIGIILSCTVLQLVVARWTSRANILGPFERLWRFLYLRSFAKTAKTVAN